MFTVGVDVGGTFTDVVLFDENTGDVRISKVPSTPPNVAEGVIVGLRALKIDLGSVRRIVHGTTVATNAILERKGAKVALVTTKGFKDLIEIGRMRRYTGGLFDPRFLRPQPLVARSLRFTVEERTSYTGEVLRELQLGDVERASEEMRRRQVEAVAVVFLHSYANPGNERRVREMLERQLPGVPVTASADVVPEYREFERFSTAVMNAYVAPVMGRYLRKLDADLQSEGYGTDLFLMSSNGGIMKAGTAASYPVRTILSGPAGGVSAGIAVARATGLRNVITYDMGGTSTDVSLVKEFQSPISTDKLVAGLPIRTPLLDINTVGAGGGSIAWVDVDGALKVGPQSAGAVPGPACYGRGGSEVTVSDANMLLGRTGPGTLLGGVMRLDRRLSERAMAALVDRVRIQDPYRLAEGIIKIVTANMCSAIREISVERGHDPRDFVLIPFGGAGPMHAIPVAVELGIPKIVVPKYPGNLSALGVISSDLRHDYVRTYLSPLRSVVPSRASGLLAEMAEEGRAALAEERVARERIEILCSADMRYLGQAWELSVGLPGEAFDPAEAEELFHREYHRAYGYSRRDQQVQLVNLRVVALGRVERPAFPTAGTPTRSLSEAVKELREVYFEGRFAECPVYDRNLLSRGMSLSGPAVVEELGATTVLFPGWDATVDDLGNLILELRS